MLQQESIPSASATTSCVGGHAQGRSHGQGHDVHQQRDPADKMEEVVQLAPCQMTGTNGFRWSTDPESQHKRRQ